MVTLIPEEPTFTTTSERVVWERLRDGLGPDDVLLANLRLTDEDKDHEADLVVLMPDDGILVLEVKGGSVWHDEQGWWIRRRRQGRATVDPVDQARDAKYALRAYVERDPRWGSRRRVAWAHGVVTPHAEFADDFAVPELPRWALHDSATRSTSPSGSASNALGTAAGQAAADVRRRRGDRRDPRRAGCHTSYDVNAEAAERAADGGPAHPGAGDDPASHPAAQPGRGARRSRQRQDRARAPAGQGADPRPRATARRSGSRCSATRSASPSTSSVRWRPGTRKRPAGVRRHLPRVRQAVGSPATATATTASSGRIELPRRDGRPRRELPDAKKYDAVIVDEAQDFADIWWRPVLKALRDEEEGGLYVYSDENQRIFARFGRPPVQLVPLVLDHNLRNTKQIHESFGPLAPSRMYSRGGDGAARPLRCRPPPRMRSAPPTTRSRRSSTRAGSPSNICLLTTGHRHPDPARARPSSTARTGYWRRFWDGDDVFYGHVLGCKGLERRAVVLCVNESKIRDRARERLYVGMSRATDVLVVVGDPGMIREVGGPR